MSLTHTDTLVGCFLVFHLHVEQNNLEWGSFIYHNIIFENPFTLNEVQINNEILN